MARSDREKEIIERFLSIYNNYAGAAFKVLNWPDDDSTGQAIDALAIDALRGHMAIEHTLLQPFFGEREDAHVFNRTVAQLEGKHNLVIPGFDVVLCFPIGAIPTGVNWDDVAPAVEKWWLSAGNGILVGHSRHIFQDLQFSMRIEVDKRPFSGAGNLSIERLMPIEGAEIVVRQALAAMLPKLTASPADIRILLLEKNSLPRGYNEIGQAIEGLRSEFPELSRVDGVWVINTVAWKAEDYTPAYLVWPLH